MESQRHVSSAFRGEINKRSVAMAENGRVIGRESWMRRNNKMVARRAHRDTRAVVSARAIAGGRCFLKAPLGIRAARTPVFLSPPSVLTRVRSRSGGEAPPKLDRRAGIILSSAESSSSLSSLANENNNLPIVLAAIRSSAVPFSRRREKGGNPSCLSVRNPRSIEIEHPIQSLSLFLSPTVSHVRKRPISAYHRHEVFRVHSATLLSRREIAPRTMERPVREGT